MHVKVPSMKAWKEAVAERVGRINWICAQVVTSLLLQLLMLVTGWSSNATNFMWQKINISWLIS